MVTVVELRALLLEARKRRDKVAEAALKRAITALEDAAAPDAAAVDPGMTEVRRLELSDADRRGVLEREAAEGLAAAEQYDAGGHGSAGDRLRAECAVLKELLNSGL